MGRYIGKMVSDARPSKTVPRGQRRVEEEMGNGRGGRGGWLRGINVKIEVKAGRRPHALIFDHNLNVASAAEGWRQWLEGDRGNRQIRTNHDWCNGRGIGVSRERAWLRPGRQRAEAEIDKDE